MPQCIVIADDLTGANATGVLLQKTGFSTMTLLQKVQDGTKLDCDCLVVPTDSRAIDGHIAYQRVYEQLSAFAGDDVRLYSKRIDSTLRGNLGTEINAFLDKLGESYTAVCVPVFPASGRVMVGNHLLVNGVPLAHTEAAHDPKCPVHTSDVLTLLRSQTRYPVHAVHLDDVHKGANQLSIEIEKQRSQGARIILVDATTMEDLDIIAQALDGMPAVSVDPGPFTAAMAKRRLLTTAKAPDGKVLCAIGSINGVAVRQTQKLLANRQVASVIVDTKQLLGDDESRQRETNRVTQALLQRKDEAPILAVVGNGIVAENRLSLKDFEAETGQTLEALSERINTAFAEIALNVLSGEPAIKGIYSTGGDITAAIHRRAGTQALRLMDEVLPLAGFGQAVGGQIDGLYCISKGGMVGDENAMITCVDYLLARKAPGKSKEENPMNRPLIAIPMGDPAGIGPEIVLKTLADPQTQSIARCVVVGSEKVLAYAMQYPNMPHLTIRRITEPSEGLYAPNTVELIDIDNVQMDAFEVGRVSGMCGKAAYEYIAKAVDLANKRLVDAVSTTPINKESLREGGVNFIGHTEIFSALTNSHDPLTLFEVRNLRVFFLSRHVSLRKACDMVTKERIVDYVIRCTQALNKLGITEGTMAIAGLNPHSGEHGLFGDEEMTAVFPAVEELKQMGYRVEGPIGADSVFSQALHGRYNSVLSLYHDQGHIATKTLDFERTISITAGMPILRTSVDHGTAFDIAGKGIASPVSMMEAVRLGVKYAPSFLRN